jgi:xylan 1,4-beta-xylosidase
LSPQLNLTIGGTEFGHCVTIARAPTVWGPFESNPSNPIAHAASRDSLFQTVGHADLFPDAAGNWHAVLLASRVVEGRFPIGRESAMVDVDWSGDWPVFDLSALEAPARVALPAPDGSTAGSWEDVLAGPTHALLHLRVPEVDSHQIITQANLNSSPPKRVVRANSVPLTAPLGSPAFLGVRQRHIYFETEIELALPSNASENFTTGYAAYLDHERHFAITINNGRACLVSVKPGAEPQNIGEGVDLLNDVTTVRLRIIGTPTKYYFDIISGTKNEWSRLGEGDTGIVSAGFTGVILAVFAVSEVGKASNTQVEVLGWRYRPTA